MTRISIARISVTRISVARISIARISMARISVARISVARSQWRGSRWRESQWRDLGGANLNCANLGGAKGITPLQEAQTSVPPVEGGFIAWKACQGDVIVKLLVPAKAQRSNASGRKCRASEALVLQVFGGDVGISQYDGVTKYRKGEIVKCDSWNTDRWTESGGGIHFFLNRIEAENYV